MKKLKNDFTCKGYERHSKATEALNDLNSTITRLSELGIIVNYSLDGSIIRRFLSNDLANNLEIS